MLKKLPTFAYIRLLNRDVLLWYEIPEVLFSIITVGSLVNVPLRNKQEIGIVASIHNDKPHSSFVIKPIIALGNMPTDAFYFKFLEKISWYYQVNTNFFLKKITQFLQNKEKLETGTLPVATVDPVFMATTTVEQQKIIDAIKPDVIRGCYSVSVVHGVTGSGKTECYKGLIQEAIKHNKTVLFLLPEVTLAKAFEDRLKHELPDVVMYGFHSGKTKKERSIVFDAIMNKDPIVIIGVHLPIMLPLANLGLIIIDEEHDLGYIEKKHPKMNTKEIALFRAQIYGIPIVLGSATPSILTLYNVEEKGWNLYTLSKRFAGVFPKIEHVSLLKKDNRPCFWVSKQLQKAIEERLENKEQTLIFINRRGINFFVQCQNCSYIFVCVSCSVSLTLHENNQLMCHYCGKTKQLPILCPTCKAPEKDFIKKGIGSQQMVKNLQKIFPTAVIDRLDSDIQKKKGSLESVLENMYTGKTDILVGTQSIAKGLHFAKVSLVGIIWADLHLHIPMFNAVEHALQGLIQVAGRAGRSSKTKNNVVIVQTIADHDMLSFISEEHYMELYTHEKNDRKQFLYPPYARLSEIEIKNNSEDVVIKEIELIKQLCDFTIQDKNMDIVLLGPTKPLIAKIDNVFSRKLYIKTKRIDDAIALYQAILQKKIVSSIFFVPSITSI